MTMDLPAPVSPVMTLKTSPNSILIFVYDGKALDAQIGQHPLLFTPFQFVLNIRSSPATKTSRGDGMADPSPSPRPRTRAETNLPSRVNMTFLRFQTARITTDSGRIMGRFVSVWGRWGNDEVRERWIDESLSAAMSSRSPRRNDTMRPSAL